MLGSLPARGLSAVAGLLAPRVPDPVVDVIVRLLGRGLRSRLVTYHELANRDGVRHWTYDRERTFEFTRPTYAGDLPDEIERLLGRHECPAPFVLEAPNILVGRNTGLKQTAQGEFVVFNYWRDRSAGAPGRGLAYDILFELKAGSIPTFRAEPTERLTSIELGVPLVTKHATNYTHWFQDCVALLEGVERFEAATGERPVLIIPADPPSFVRESLKRVGFGDHQIHELTDGHIHLKRAVLPSTRRCLSRTSDDYFRMISGLEWVRNRVLADVPNTGGDGPNLLISREDADSRRIVNLETVADALDPFGFEMIVPGRLSFDEQVRRFSRANLIIGAHGAGMINSIYAREAGILELYGSHFLPANFELAQGLGNRYGCLRCEPSRDDFLVDIERLERAVRQLAVET